MKGKGGKFWRKKIFYCRGKLKWRKKRGKIIGEGNCIICGGEKKWRREIYFLRKRSKMENEMKGNILRTKIFFCGGAGERRRKMLPQREMNEQTNKERQDCSANAGPWKAEMSTKSVKETRLETTCTHHFQFLSVAKDEVNRRKGMVIKIFGRRKIMHVLGQGCIFRLTCSYPELPEDHVLTSAYVKSFRTVTRNAVNKSV